MNAPRSIPPYVIEHQLRASDPDVSAWVAANAGSGKTHVLTQRVISLLLKGEDPAKILCITFTKAAAANMASRIFRDLAAWISLDDAGLDRRLVEIGQKPGLATRTRARRLFALALETPGGLKVQTIHAFCTRLLHQFPFEADVAARFTVLDEASEHQLLEKLILETMLEGAANRDSALGQALAVAIAQAADQTLLEVIRDAIRQRDLILGWVDGVGSVDAAIGQLSQALGVAMDDTVEKICAECDAEGVPAREWNDLCTLFSSGKSFDLHQAERWKRAAEAGWPDAIDPYLSVFLRDDDGTPKKDQYVMGKDLRLAHPALWERLAAERERAVSCAARLRGVRYRDRTRALLTLAYAIIARYRTEKSRRGLLDYDDLIDKTLALFRKTSAAWVLFKLDLGVNHILIDEAQDTSPKQWEIIRTLVSEFTAGAGARAAGRTLFAVGDDKQSIFSFQGAAPEKFSDMRRQFEREFRAAELEMRVVRLQTSFRSGEVVLNAVDQVFAGQTVSASLTSDADGIPPHIALPDAAPGCVDIWPLTPSDPKDKPEGWDAPFDTRSETSPQVRLAQRIATNVALRTAAGSRPGDVLILVRQRGPLFEAIIRALKAAHIPVAGADRLLLTGHIAVMDLMALADALLLPEDDLALATVLKSPIFGFDDGDLLTIALNRGEKSLRTALLARSGEKEKFADAARVIERLTDDARRVSPFTFYARLLGPGRGRKKFLSRLGPEANDALDEFLNLALDYETRETPSLQGFVAWLRAAQAEVKRDMEQDRDEVRVMTVHGAKGLEAPVVILADTTTKPAGYHPPRLIPLAVNGGSGLVWAGNKASDPAAVAEARRDILSANESEYRRLLYVAMTRAQAHLIICGVGGKPTKNDGAPKPPGCWYQLVEDALVKTETPVSEEIEADDGGGKIWRFLKSQPLPQHVVASDRATVMALPDWLAELAPVEPPRIVPVSPSEAWDDSNRARSELSGMAREKAIQRGTLVHRLMQSLPDIPAGRREAAARSYLQRAADKLDDGEREDVLAQVQAILGAGRFASLFAAGSRAEVPIVGRIARPGRTPLLVSGQIDRLAVTPGSVLIGDFKTNHAPPRSLDDALAAYPEYILQLALYRAVLQMVYPGHAVGAALIWTEIPDLMEIPGHTLDTALDRLTSA
jgi:ATP-dependent helicase/nuclease subunit A